MGRWGRADFRQLQQLERQIDKLEKADFDKFCRSTAKELAGRLLNKVVKRTPVGDYSGDSYICQTGQPHKGRYVRGKVGGTLRRGWTAGNDKSAMYSALFKGKAINPKDYVNSLPIDKQGNEYVVTIINPVEYASYVEYGHRTVNGKGWAPGHFMLTISAQEVENLMPSLLEKRLYELIKGLF